ncbi:MAG: PASTA domain-containing protein [Fimbriimonadaceae bacterium]|nr:PASTA domain-containing protein [Fimbriimonadaceae bacterium]
MIGNILRLRYELLENLHDEPLFDVYAARDKVSARDVCIRILKQPYASETKFVTALGEIIARLKDVQSPSLERVLEIDRDEKHTFLVCELSKGTLLSDRIKRLAPFSAPVSLSIAISICEGLTALHRVGLTHGDIGSHNVIVDPEGNAKIKLSAFWPSYSASMTAGSVVLPNMAPYLAPEVSKGDMPTAPSDVYGMGVILFELLTGRKPFVADQPVAMAIKHATDTPPFVKNFNAAVPNALNEIVSKTLSKDPKERYNDAGELLSELRFVQDALRFGRSAAAPASVAPARSGAAGFTKEPAGVAPKMSAIKEETKAKPKPTKVDDEDYDDGVPSWLKMVMIFVAALVIFTIGGFVMFNMTRPKIVKVPDIRRLTVTEAESRLKQLDLKMRIMRRETSEEFATNTVIEMDPPPSNDSYVGSVIGVVVSDGSRFVEVPDLRGLSVDKAKITLQEIGLVGDDRVDEVRDRQLEPGLVVSHVPESRKRVERGTKVRFRVSSQTSGRSDRADETKYLYTIRIRLTGLTASVGLRVDMTDARGTRTVHEDFHDPDNLVEITAEGYGAEAVFRIFYDGELVKQVTKKADAESLTPDTDEEQVSPPGRDRNADTAGGGGQ